MKQLLLVGLLAISMPLLAQQSALSPMSFPVDVELDAQGLDLTTTSTGNVGNLATVTVTNQDPRSALCVATFVNGPEKPSPLRARVAPGEKTVLTQALRRDIIRVRVSVKCSAD